MEAAIDLAAVSPKVYLIESSAGLTGDEVLRRRVAELPNIEILPGARITEIVGEEKVSALRFRRDGEEGELAVEGIFVEVGLLPNSEPFRGFVDLNERGEVLIDCSCRTSRPGVFAAGDVTAVPFKQIVIAAGDGAKAALAAYDYLLRRGRGASSRKGE